MQRSLITLLIISCIAGRLRRRLSKAFFEPLPDKLAAYKAANGLSQSQLDDMMGKSETLPRCMPACFEQCVLVVACHCAPLQNI